MMVASSVSSQQYRESELRRYIDEGAILMKRGFYDSANQKFQIVLQNLDELPSNIAYYFGRNSFHIGKFKQSINWLNKYIQLKGTRGQYYSEAVKYLTYAEKEYMQLQRMRNDKLSEALSKGEYECGGLEKMLCPVCHGNGVVILEGTFDNLYKTCPYSLGEGFLSCEEYNLFMQGRLDMKVSN